MLFGLMVLVLIATVALLPQDESKTPERAARVIDGDSVVVAGV